MNSDCSQNALPPPSPSRGLRASSLPRQTPRAIPSQQDAEPVKSHKRKRSPSSDAEIPKTSKKSEQQSSHIRQHPIAYWAEHGEWPASFFKIMSPPQLPPLERPAGTTWGGSGHWSALQKALIERGIFMNHGSNQLHADDKELISQLSRQGTDPAPTSGIHADKLVELSELLSNRNEAAVQRYMLPHFVPSPMEMRQGGMPINPGLDEETNAKWIRAQSLLTTRPQPDYVVGLNKDAFDNPKHFDKLQRYATVDNAAFVTPNMCLPFLICEVKSAQTGLINAERQALHSAAIAVGSIFNLCEAAYGKDSSEVRDLQGRLLVFSVVLNHSEAKLFGHCAKITDAGTRQYFRHYIAAQELGLPGCSPTLMSTHVQNIYQVLAPLHIQRIQDALDSLASAALRPATAPSPQFREVEESGDDDDFGTSRSLPDLPNGSAMFHEQMMRLREKMEEDKQMHREEMQQQEHKLEQVYLRHQQQLEALVEHVKAQKAESSNWWRPHLGCRVS